MILYHGTNVDFDKIDLSRAEPYKDFGTGFYTTTLYDQAMQMAKRKSRIFGGAPCVLSFDAPNDLLSLPSVRVKRFDKPTKEWAVFIINNRNRDFDAGSSPLSNRDNKFDIVYGPVANDTLTTLIQRYHHGFIDEDVLLREMEYVSPTEQYSFHTEAAIALLKKVGAEWLK